jgi:putative spermidine/putrescine transport system permease protein
MRNIEYSLLDRVGQVVVMAMICLGLVVMLAPVAMTIILSFSDRFVFPPSGFTLHWYANFLSRPEFIEGLKVSLVLAAATVLTSTALGIGIALAITRHTFPGRAALNLLFLSPITLPRVAIGVAILLFFVAIDVRGAPLRLFVLHVVLTCPYVVAVIGSSLQGVDPTLEQAALNLGAPPLEAFRKVTLPLIRPAIVTSVLFAFVVSFDEVTASIFVTDARTITFPVALFSYLARSAVDPTVAAGSSFMLVFVAGIVIALARYVGLARALGIWRAP